LGRRRSARAEQVLHLIHAACAAIGHTLQTAAPNEQAICSSSGVSTPLAMVIISRLSAIATTARIIATLSALPDARPSSAHGPA
jgi:hypothetical protein